MNIAFAGAIPATKLDAELEGSLCLAHELRFVDLEQLVEVAQRGQRGLADPHGADVIGLDEREAVTLGMQDLRARGRAHPAGRTAADDDDLHGRHAYPRCRCSEEGESTGTRDRVST